MPKVVTYTYYEVLINSRCYGRFIQIQDAELFLEAKQIANKSLGREDRKYEIVEVERRSL